MRAFALIGLLAMAAATLPGAALACRLRPLPPPVERVRAAALQRYAGAAVLVEAEAVAAADEDGLTTMRVLRTYKGEVRPGAIISVMAPATITCGCDGCSQGPPDRGERGLMLLDRTDRLPDFSGFLSGADVALYRQLGLLPPAR